MTRSGILYELSGPGEDVYRSFAGMAGRLDTDLDRAENIPDSGVIQLFHQLWQHCQKEVFLRATRRLLTVLGNALPDAVASPVADAIRYYRRATGRREYDQHITQVVHELAHLTSVPRV